MGENVDRCRKEIYCLKNNIATMNTMDGTNRWVGIVYNPVEFDEKSYEENGI